MIKKYKTNNPFEIAKEKNIIILKIPLPEDVNGFYQYYKRNKIIYLNDNLCENDQRIVCAHELGHALLHTKLNIVFLEKNTFVVKNKYEIEADTFCAHLLLPENELKEYRYSGYTTDQISCITGLPSQYINLIK